MAEVGGGGGAPAVGEGGVRGTLMRKVGPLPLWAWALAAGAAVLVVRVYLGRTGTREGATATRTVEPGGGGGGGGGGEDVVTPHGIHGPPPTLVQPIRPVQSTASFLPPYLTLSTPSSLASPLNVRGPMGTQVALGPQQSVTFGKSSSEHVLIDPTTGQARFAT